MSISMTGAPLVVWEDASLNVRVIGGNGRFEIRYPLIIGETGIPDFTTRADAISYAEHVAKTLRFTRDVAHGTALREEARRAKSRTTTVDLVLRDREGDRWVRVGQGGYLLASGIISGHGVRRDRARIERDRAHIENRFGPLTVEHSIEIRGEVVA